MQKNKRNIAKKLGISESHLINILAGRRRLSITKAIAIEKKQGINLRVWLGSPRTIRTALKQKFGSAS